LSVETSRLEHVIDELADMAPGPELGAALATIDRSVLNGHQLVLVMCARARQVAHDQAHLLADMVAVAHCPPGGPDAPPRRARPGSASSPRTRSASRWDTAADAQLDLACTLVHPDAAG
jgi:hypothetical protein